MLNNASTLIAAAKREPSALAIIDKGKAIDYESLLSLSTTLGCNLLSLGLTKGSHLVTLLQNNWQSTLIYWACQLYGIIITPINWRTTSEELEYYIGDAKAEAIIFQDVSMDAVASCNFPKNIIKITIDKSKPVVLNFENLFKKISPENDFISDEKFTSIMLYTSGTTGIGKGVPRSHSAEKSSALAHIFQNQYAFKEKTLGVMPLYHTMGVRLLLSMCTINGCFVCQSKFNPTESLKLIEKEKITSLYLVPTLYHDLISNNLFSSKLIKTVSKIGFAGAPMNEDLVKKLYLSFNPKVFVNHYGSTEIFTFSYKENVQTKPGSAGKAGINQIIRVIDLESSDVKKIAEVGREGKIIASMSSSEAFTSYWNKPESNKNSIVDGWYITGDIGYLDCEGELFITGRIDDMIISGGENIFPVELENILASFEGVIEAVVCGLPDERLGEIVAAFIKSDKQINANQLEQLFLKSKISRFKRPRKYYFVEEIPKSPVGKILRRKLKEKYS